MRGQKISLLKLEDDRTMASNDEYGERVNKSSQKNYHKWIERIVSSRLVSFLTCNEIQLQRNFQEAIHSEAPKAVVQTMKNFPHNGRVQRMGLKALRDMAGDSWKTKTLILDVGGVDTILKCMRLHPKDSIIQRYACQCLYNLTAGGAPKILIDKGGVSALLQTIDYHADDEDVLPDACDCLLALTDHQNEEALRMVRQRLGGVALVKMEHKYRGRNGEIAKKAGELLRRIYL